MEGLIIHDVVAERYSYKRQNVTRRCSFPELYVLESASSIRILPSFIAVIALILRFGLRHIQPQQCLEPISETSFILILLQVALVLYSLPSRF